MNDNQEKTRFAVCINNEGYPASLEIHKIYRTIPDESGPDLLSVVDESGESYLYPTDYFVPVDLPQAVVETFTRAA